MLAWDALATSLEELAGWVDGAQAEQLRAEVEKIRSRIAQLAPDHWSVKRERACSLWRWKATTCSRPGPPSSARWLTRTRTSGLYANYMANW